MENITKISKSPEETMNLGEWLAGRLKSGSVVALCGEFGVGKTVFVKGIARGMKVKDVLHDVISPSFTVVKEYEGTLSLYHLDLYRITSEDDLDTIGYQEYLSMEGIVIIEWADKFLELFPEKIIKVDFETLSETERKITIAGI